MAVLKDHQRGWFCFVVLLGDVCIIAANRARIDLAVPPLERLDLSPRHVRLQQGIAAQLIELITLGPTDGDRHERRAQAANGSKSHLEFPNV